MNIKNIKNTKNTIKGNNEHAYEIRRLIIQMVSAAGCGHPGGPLGLADIFAVLFFDILRINAKSPQDVNRDRLVLSNGHVCAVLYASMYLAGYFQEHDPLLFRKFKSPFQGHPSIKYLPEITNSSGSLGQGLSAAVGLALGLKYQKRKSQVYACISDGECGEGMTWEAATFAAHSKAPLIAFIDNNGIQIDGKTKDVCDLRDLELKFKSFGWHTRRVDGHNHDLIKQAFYDAKIDIDKGLGPQLIVFDTILGKGVSYMEDQFAWHGKAPNEEETQIALQELAENFSHSN